MRNDLKILLLNWQDIKNPFGGGAEVHLHEIFSRIADKGHEITLLSCSHEELPKEEIVDGLQIFRRGSRNLFNYHVYSLYKEFSSRHNYDIVIDDINKIPFFTPLYVTEPLLAVSHHFFGTSIFREAGLIGGSYVYLSEMLVDIIYKNTQFAVVSQSTLDEFIDRGFSKNNFSIVSNAISQENFPMCVSKKNAEPVITYFGRLKKYKSVDHLFRAFAIIKQKFPEARLEIIGRGDFKDYLDKLSVDLGIEKSVIFHGFVSEEDKSMLLSRSHLVVNTSMKEGWGITNIEANACGTPVISANVPGLKDSVSVGKSGLLYEYGNINDLAEKIKSVLDNSAYFDELCTGSVEWAKQFSWDKSANDMIESINRAISRKNG